MLQGENKEAVDEFDRALRVKSDLVMAHSFRASALSRLKDYDRAAEAFRQAIHYRPEAGSTYLLLAGVLRTQKKLPDAEKAALDAIQHQPPDLGKAYYDLGEIRIEQSKNVEAEQAFREAIGLHAPDLHLVYNGLGASLGRQRKLVDAEAAYRESVRLKTDYSPALRNLAFNLTNQSKLADAEKVFRDSLRLKPDDALSMLDLGDNLMKQGRFEEAEMIYRDALDKKPQNPGLVHADIGWSLRNQAKFAESLVEYRQAHELAPKNPEWHAPTAEWLQQAERYVEAERILPDALRNENRPADAAMWIALAEMCKYRHWYRGAAHCYEAAFKLQPALADDLSKSYRYNAACYAALTCAGQSKEEAVLGEADRIRLHNQVIDNLRADLALWSKRAATAKPEDVTLVHSKMLHWLADADLVNVREQSALSNLPEAERLKWEKLWKDVADLLDRTQPTDGK
jgi:tetratricopeptide (TPR) repeat protein